MSTTTFSGPVRAGTIREGAAANLGFVVLTQSYDSGDLTGDGVGNYDAPLGIVPAGTQILDIFVDQVVAATAGTTTVSVGSTSGGTQLMAAVATTAGGRFRGVQNAATQLAKQTSTTSDTPIFVRAAVGTATLTAGRFIVTVTYAQKQR